MSGPYIKRKSWLTLVTESTWGTLPGSPVYIHVPCESYGVKFVPVNRKGAPAAGLLQHHHSRDVKGWPSGQIPVRLFGWHPPGLDDSPDMSLAQYLMTLAFENPETGDLPSFSSEWTRGPNVANKRHLGMRTGGASLTGSEDQALLLSLTCAGKDEVGQSVMTTGNSLPNDRFGFIEFLFEHCEFELNGSPIDVGSFTWTVERRQVVKCYNSTRPKIIRATDFVETFSISKPFDSDVWCDEVRALDPTSFHELTMTIRGPHLDTGEVDTEWTQGVIEFGKLKLLTEEEQGDDIVDQQLNFDVLKPDTADNGHTITWSDEA